MMAPRRIIVVDDDRINNKLCERIIKKVFRNTEILIFTMPEMAIEFISEQYERVDVPMTSTLLFLDINMPTMTGWEFLNKFSRMSSHIHEQFVTFILSSSVDKKDKDKAEVNPFVSGFLAKPLTGASLEQLFIAAPAIKFYPAN